MPKFAANLSFLYPERAFLDRFAAARADGFTAVELLLPYDYPTDVLAHHLLVNNLQLVLHNLPAGDWGNGERGMACDPTRGAEFRASVALAAQYASALQVKQLHCLAGLVPTGVTPAAAHACYVDNLRYAARRLARDGIGLLIEPINRFDMPGYFLTGSDQAAAILDQCQEPNVFMQLDLYHLQRMGEHLADALQRHLPRVRHMQLADAPGRHQPGTGSIDFRALFALIDRLGYAGWIGCEYTPQGDTSAGLGWRSTLCF